MAAIAGIIASTTEDLRSISAMTDLLAHRGTDGDGILWLRADGTHRLAHNALPGTAPVPARAALGHRRRAGMAQQPLSSESGRYWLAGDITLYNQAELGTLLGREGADAASLVLAAYEAHGDAAFGMFDGPFAIALLDTETKRLTLARDTQGQRPLFYWAHRGWLAFASEIKALFAIPEIRPKLERQAITAFLQGLPVADFRTPFAHIFALPPGHLAHIAWDSPIPVRPVPYPQPAMPSNAGDGRARFLAAVARQASDGDIGISLTGGVASTAIATALREQRGETALLNSFTAIAETLGCDERTWVAAANGSAHTLANTVMPSPEDFMTELDTLIWHLDEPFGSLGIYAQWCLARAAYEAKIPRLFEGSGAPGSIPVLRQSLMAKLWPNRDPIARALAKLAPGLALLTPPTAPPPVRYGERAAMAFGIELHRPFLDSNVVGTFDDRASMVSAFGNLLPEPIPTRPHHEPYALPLEDWMREHILPAFMRDIKLAKMPLVPIVHGGEMRELVQRQVDRPDPALTPLIFRVFIANRWMQRFGVAPVI